MGLVCSVRRAGVRRDRAGLGIWWFGVGLTSCPLLGLGRGGVHAIATQPARYGFEAPFGRVLGFVDALPMVSPGSCGALGLEEKSIVSGSLRGSMALRSRRGALGLSCPPRVENALSRETAFAGLSSGSCFFGMHLELTKAQREARMFCLRWSKFSEG